MAEVKAETALEEIKRRRDEWIRKTAEHERNGLKFHAFESMAKACELNMVIEILESKGE